MNLNKLPYSLKKIISSQKTDFIVKSSKEKSLKEVIPSLIFTLLFILVLGFISFKFINPILEKEFLDTVKVTEINEWGLLMIPAIALGVFGVISIGLLIKTIKLFFNKGVYFAGTETHLIIHKSNSTTSITWSSFSGKTTIKQKHNYGNLSLELKAKKAINIIVDEDIYEDNPDEELIAKTIEMIGIRNIIDIERKCNYRINQY